MRKGKEVTSSKSATQVMDDIYNGRTAMTELRFTGLSDFKPWIDSPTGVFNRTKKEVYKLAQESMTSRAVPDEFVVWMEKDASRDTFGRVLLSPQGDFINGSFKPYLVNKRDILGDLNTLTKTMDPENPLFMDLAKLRRVDPSAEKFIREFMASGARNIEDALATIKEESTVVQTVSGRAKAVAHDLMKRRTLGFNRAPADEAWDFLGMKPGEFVGDRAEEKIAINKRISDELKTLYRQDDVFKQLIDERSSHIMDPNQYIERKVRATIDGWARTSVDDDAWAIAVQERAAARFGMDDALAVLKKRVARKQVSAQVENLLQKEGNVIDKILDTMYKQTQERFAELGIKEVTLYRGYAVNSLPKFIKNALPADTLQQLSQAVGFGHRPIVLQDVTLEAWGQPLNSFSAFYNTAQNFSSGSMTGRGGKYQMVMGTRVPVEYIIGTSKTGFGCLNEFEFVLRGDVPGEGTISILRRPGT